MISIFNNFNGTGTLDYTHTWGPYCSGQSILTDFGLKQPISSPTRITRESKTLIDVICSNVAHNIFSVKVIQAGLSDHELIGGG